MSTGLLDGVSPTAAATLLAAGIRRRYPARTYLFHENDEPTTVFLVESGLIRVERSLRSGRTVLLTLAGPGRLVGELSAIEGMSRSATAVTVSASRVLAVPTSAFVELVNRDGELGHAVLCNVTQRLRALTDQLVDATTLPAAGRVAARVIEVLDATDAERAAVDEPIDLRMPISQDELAQWAGLSREGAVKGLTELRAAGVIETGRKRMVILDVSRLRAAANGTRF